MALISNLCGSVLASIVGALKVVFSRVLVGPLVNTELEDAVVLWVSRLISDQEAKSWDPIVIGVGLAS